METKKEPTMSNVKSQYRLFASLVWAALRCYVWETWAILMQRAYIAAANAHDRALIRSGLMDARVAGIERRMEANIPTPPPAPNPDGMAQTMRAMMDAQKRQRRREVFIFLFLVLPALLLLFAFVLRYDRG